MPGTWIRIGELARRAGVSVQAVRYYERHGLFRATPRRASGHREFPPALADWIRFIKLAQRLGFSLREILELKRIAGLKGASRRQAIGERLTARINDIDARIQALTAVRAVLEGFRSRPPDDDVAALVARIGEETERLAKGEQR